MDNAEPRPRRPRFAFECRSTIGPSLTHARRRGRAGTRNTGTRSSRTEGTGTPTSGVPQRPRPRTSADALDRQGFASDFRADVRRRFRTTPGDDPVDRLIAGVEVTEQELRDGVSKLKEMRIKRYAMESLSDHHEYVRMRRDIETWQADPRHVYSVYGDM